MFSNLAALTLVVPFVSALSLNVPKNLQSGGQATISWTGSETDMAFSLFLLNTIFHDSFAISNNLQPLAGSVTLEMPVVPVGSGYTLEATQIGNITNVFATSGTFSVGALGATSSSSGSGTSSGASSKAVSGTKSSTASTVAYTPPSTASSFGVTLTNTPTYSSTASGFGTTATGSNTDSTTATSSSASTSSSGTVFNAGSSIKFSFSTGSIAVGLLSAIAGVVIVAL